MIILAVLTIGAISKATMDILRFHFKESIFSDLNVNWWNPRISWKNKYKNGSITIPRFFGSTTFLVWITDAWHLFQMIMLNCFFLSIVLYSKEFTHFVDFLIYMIYFKVIFEIFYKWILRIN